MESTKHSKKWILIAIALAVVVAVSFLLQPNNQKGALSSVSDKAIAIGVHQNIRKTWKSQLRAPIVKQVLSGYGLEADELIEEPGVFWTFRIAIGDILVSSLVPAKDGKEYIICAASPASRRAFLIKLFYALKWIPGLGKLSTLDDGTRYVNIASRKAKKPLYLSLSYDDNVLFAKLYREPLGFEDIIGTNGSTEAIEMPEDRNIAHSFTIKNSYLKQLGLANEGGDAKFSLTFPAEDVVADMSLPLTREEIEIFSPLFRCTLVGRNAVASSLASDYAVALVLLPSHFASPIVRDYLACEKGASSDEDAVAYITRSPYGAKIFAFDLPAITAIIPGLSISEEVLQAALRKDVPKMLRPFFALQGGNTICSYAASLREQRKAQPAQNKTWKDFYGKIVDSRSPCGYAFLDVDPLARELKQVFSAVQMLSSFGAIKLSKSEKKQLSNASKALPLVPTKSAISVAIFAPEENDNDLKVRLQLSQR